MQYRILCVGKIKDAYYREAVEFRCNQIRKWGNQIEVIEFPDRKIPETLTDTQKETFLEKECSGILEKISDRDYVIALCIEGQELTTKRHKACLEKAKADGWERIVYVIGGSLGLPDKLKKRANLRLSFSKMTFPHQLMRLVLCEELAHITGKNVYSG